MLKYNKGNCNYNYIGTTKITENITMGVIDAVHYINEDGKNMLIVTSIIDDKSKDGEAVFAPSISISTNLTYNTDDIEFMSKDISSLGYFVNIHNDSYEHKQIVYGVELPYNIKDVEYYILNGRYHASLFEYKLLASDIREVDSKQSYNIERFNDAYQIIDDKFSNNDDINIKLNEFYLEGQDFIINYDIKNNSKKDFYGLNVFPWIVSNKANIYCEQNLENNERNIDLKA